MFVQQHVVVLLVAVTRGRSEESPPIPPVAGIVISEGLQQQTSGASADPGRSTYNEDILLRGAAGGGDNETNDKPYETSGVFEGDITNVDMKSRNAVRQQTKVWKRAIIPYVISRSFSQSERSVIRSAVDEFRQKTCVRFVPRSNEADYVYFRKLRGCSSDVGRSGGVQVISLGSGCLYHGITVHEMMHAAGFWHEQSRADRDQYVIVYWQNIAPGLAYNFDKYTLKDIQHLGEAYDYNSIMHYERTAFSRDGRSPTIVPKQSGVKIGQRNGLSEVDARKINKLYQCNGGGQVVTTVTPPEACRDTGGQYCSYWARNGYCSGKYSTYMATYCRKSCRLCNTEGGGIQCEDQHQLCAAWSRFGQCTANPNYMLQFCKRSCNVCDDDGGSVRDCENVTSDRSCNYWSGIGECDRNPGYMKQYCKKSCNTC